MNLLKRGPLAFLALWIAATIQAQGITIFVDDQLVRFTSGAGPRMMNGRVLVPLRGVFESMGAYVTFDPTRNTITASRDDIDVLLSIGNRTAYVGDQRVELDVAPMIVRGTTFVPLRFIGEALGAQVRWSEPDTAVYIESSPVAEIDETVRPRDETLLPPAARITIQSIGISARDWIRSDQAVRVTVRGTPGATATFDIPGIVSNVPMQEISSGMYEGTWMPDIGQRNLALTNASILVTLERAGQRATTQSSQTLSIDTSPPVIRPLIPDRSTVTTRRPTITARIDEIGSGINPNTVVLRINGRDETARARITDSMITYTPTAQLPLGENTVEVVASDRAGNETSARWTFNVEAASRMVRTLTHNARRNMQAGDTIIVTLTGQPGSTATFSIGDTITNIPMNETRSGTYRGEYVLRRGDAFANAPITATLVTPDGDQYNIQASTRVDIETARSMGPTITSPSLDQVIMSPMVIRGTAYPNSRVHVRVSYTSSMIGDVSAQGTLFDQIIQADENGSFRTSEIYLGGLALNKSTEYTITATTVSATGQTSEQTVLSVRQR